MEQQSPSNDPVLPIGIVKEIADSAGVFDDEELTQSLQFLSDLGSIQFFSDELLCDRVITNPQWIVDVLAALISAQNDDKIEQHGILHYSQIESIWSKYPAKMHNWLLQLTEVFDLTFPMLGKSASLIPCLLPEELTVSFDPTFDRTRSMKIAIHFQYLPPGLFNRAQVRLFRFTDKENMSKTSCILRKSEHRAIMTQNHDTASIQIEVNGPKPDNLAFLILDVFDNLINESFSGIHPEYLFSCPECVMANVQSPSMLHRSKIKRASELHVPFIQCSEYFHCIPTQELRQLLPADSAYDFDNQLYRSVKQMSGMSDDIVTDVLILGSKSDDGTDTKVTEPVKVGEDLKAALNGSLELRSQIVSNVELIPFDQLAAFIRSTTLVVCCVSRNFMNNEHCQSALLCARETYKKHVVIAFIEDFDWKINQQLAFLLGNDLFIKAMPDRYDPVTVFEIVKQRFQSTDASTHSSSEKAVFLSYCWQNSQDAVNKGTRRTPGAIGVTDPRKLKQHLDDHGFNCWIDIEEVGKGALFEMITSGLRNAKVIVVCVSDEYCNSENCLREFRFATSACCLPVILCVVGTGFLWKQSEVALVASQSVCHNFQIENPENYVALLKSVERFAPKSNVPNIKRQNVFQNLQGLGVCFSETLELTQRRFLRQILAFHDNTNRKSTPHLILIDILPSFNVVTNSEKIDESIDMQQWCIRFLCESEDGWHLSSSSFPINQKYSVANLFRQCGGYLSRLFSVIRNISETPRILAPRNEIEAIFFKNCLLFLEKFVNFEQSFEFPYLELKAFLASNEVTIGPGNLTKVHLAAGKELWLCTKHQEIINQHRTVDLTSLKDKTKCDVVLHTETFSNVPELIDTEIISNLLTKKSNIIQSSRACCVQ